VGPPPPPLFPLERREVLNFAFPLVGLFFFFLSVLYLPCLAVGPLFSFFQDVWCTIDQGGRNLPFPFSLPTPFFVSGHFGFAGRTGGVPLAWDFQVLAGGEWREVRIPLLIVFLGLGVSRPFSSAQQDDVRD